MLSTCTCKAGCRWTSSVSETIGLGDIEDAFAKMGRASVLAERRHPFEPTL